MSGDYVYAIQREAGGPIKIGKAVNVKARLAGLQTGTHEKLVILREWSRPKGDGVLVERMSHSFLDEHRVGGEWFAVTLEQAAEAIERAMALADIPRGMRAVRMAPEPEKKGPPPEEVAWAKANPGIIANEILKWHMEK